MSTNTIGQNRKKEKKDTERRKLSSFMINVLAGGGSGCIETGFTYPLDLVKTRLQLESASKSASTSSTSPSVSLRYGRIMEIMIKIVKNDGWRGLYRGLSSPLVSEVPRRAVKFSSSAYYREVLERNWRWVMDLKGGDDVHGRNRKNIFDNSDKNMKYSTRNNNNIYSNTLISLLAGTFTGFTEAALHTPFEVVKIRMQSKEYSHLRTSLDCTKKIIRDEKLMGLFRGMESYLLRQGLWNGLYFGGIAYLKEAFPLDHFTYKVLTTGKIETNVREEEEKVITDIKGRVIMHNFLIGLISGSVATILNTPLDVAKTRIQHYSTFMNNIKKETIDMNTATFKSSPSLKNSSRTSHPVPTSTLNKTSLKTISGKSPTRSTSASTTTSSFQVLKNIFAEEGFAACFKGLGARLIRSAPGSGILLVFYEILSARLKEYEY